MRNGAKIEAEEGMETGSEKYTTGRKDHAAGGSEGSTLRGVLRLVALLIIALFWLIVAPPILLIARLAGGEKGYLRLVTMLVGPFCRSMAFPIGLHVTMEGKPDPVARVFVANHVSWLDIITGGISISGVFVSRHDLRDWPGIGLFSRLAGTIFIDRSSLRSAITSSAMIVDRASKGIRVLFFPEGRATRGDEVEPFKQFLFSETASAGFAVQPITILYTRLDGEPTTEESRDLLYWYRDDQEFADHAWRLLRRKRIDVRVLFHPPVTPPSPVDRTSLRLFVEELHRATSTGVPVWGTKGTTGSHESAWHESA